MIGDDELKFLDDAWRHPSGKRDRGGKAAVLAVGALKGGGRSGGSGQSGGGSSRRDKLARLVNRAPEVMVKVTGRQRGRDHTAAHLDYIGRHGKLDVETNDGEIIRSEKGLHALAAEWSEQESQTTRRREPLTSVSMILSMPPGSDPEIVYHSARAFARTELSEFGWAMALHTDTGHPHVHVTVTARGEADLRFNPRKEDLARYRESFARELRARGIAAEATPRRARGVVQKRETTSVRKMRERQEVGKGALPRVLQSATHASTTLANERPPSPRPWEIAILAKQAQVRATYRAAAGRLADSDDPQDRALGARVAAFVAEMPEPATRDRAASLNSQLNHQSSSSRKTQPSQNHPTLDR
jgi:hypothetical protein